jgi:glycosyltransferase involved in cell wall biosynthesis
VQQLGVADRVRLLGLRDDVPAVLKAIDAFVLPTLEEALGTSFLEAMAMGKPVIGTRVGGVPEVIREGVNGLLVPPGDPQALGGAIVGLLSNIEAARAMGRAGRSIVEREFTVEHMCQRMFDLYSGLLQGRV